MKYTTWSDEMENELKEMIKQNKSLLAICCRLKITKNVLISHLKRNGYSHAEIMKHN